MGSRGVACQQMAKCGFVPITINEWPLLAKRRTTRPNALFMVSARVSNCFHLSALCLCRCCFTALETLLGHGRRGLGGARGSQCSLFTIYNSALFADIRAGARAGEEVGVSERIHWPFEKKKQLYCLPKWWGHSSSGKSQLLIQQHRLRPNSSTFVSPLSGRTRWIKERKQLVCQKQKHFNKRK